MLNWRPVYDIELKELESERRTKLLESEIAQIENEIVQLDIENKRLAELESRMDALLLSADFSSQTPPAAGSN